MKKFLKTLLKIIIVLVIIVILLIAALFILVPDDTKTPMTSNDFFEMMAAENFAVDETSDDLEEYGVSLEKCFKAYNSNCEMVFYELNSTQDAETLFDIYKEEVESIYHSSSISTNRTHYNIYQTFASDYFKYVSRVENTLLYVESDIGDKDDTKAIIEKMGY